MSPSERGLGGSAHGIAEKSAVEPATLPLRIDG